jgi:regulator of sirC expression with transglutaminase-like and TPR domain
LALEAAVARIDALLLAGKRAEALERLARLPLQRVGRRNELQLVRGELYSEHDCTKASADFSAVLAADASGPLAERALYGRALCRLRQSDPSATTDLRTYLDRYPNGRFASAVREHLAAIR